MEFEVDSSDRSPEAINTTKRIGRNVRVTGRDENREMLHLNMIWSLDFCVGDM